MVRLRPLAVALLLSGCEGLVEPGAVDEAGPLPVMPGLPQGSGGGAGEVPVPHVLVAEPLHRLNRAEYDNTVRDLLGTSLRPARAFPPDTFVGGFDNAADALTLPASLFALYAESAKALAESTLRITPRFTAHVEARAVGIATAQPGAAFENWGWTLTGTFTTTVAVPRDELTTLTVVAGGAHTAAAPVPQLSLWVDGQKLKSFAITAAPASPQVLSVSVVLLKGARKVQVSFDNFLNEPAMNEGNQAVIGALDLVSAATVTPPGRSKVYVCEPSGPQDAACYERIALTFAERAYRHPLGAEETKTVLALQRTLAASEGAPAATELVVRAVLLSPQFLFRASVAGVGSGPASDWVPLDDFALASRLSYFLWSSMPDDALLAAAGTGALRSESGLRAQVTRMLEDPRSQALREGFAAAWLGVRALESSRPDPTAFPTFTEPVREALKEETGLFFDAVLREGRPVTDLLTPDFGFTSDLLAHRAHEPLPGSAAMVRVARGPSERRGILSLGAYLTSTSDPVHTSPVRRGRFVLEQFLGFEIPPPPPGIPPLPTDASAGTVRERLAEHRKDPTCAACHNQVDPVGLGLEEYDAVGLQRATENGAPIDTSGALGGQRFEGANALAALLRDDPRFVRTLTAKLYAYALGRAKVPEDTVFIDELTRALPREGGRLSDLVTLIVLSPPFRLRPVAETSP
ncbi:MAG: DUF1592 domain-containing protein [Myxococcaceae bacterium]|nr:DUF1592 domain-containing protein [Myxococcaceae bacterium]